MSFAEHETHHQRRDILDILALQNDYAQNQLVVKDCLKMIGHTVSSDKVVTEFHWLKEQGLIEINNVGDFHVAKLTERGLDVAEGASAVPGIARKGV